MSRIHEALKKAEQERATLQGGAASGFPVPEDLETTSAAWEIGFRRSGAGESWTLSGDAGVRRAV